MIIQINQVGSKYQVIYKNQFVGDFEFLKKNSGIQFNSQCGDNWIESKVAQAIYAFFEQGVSVKHSNKKTQDFVVNQFDRKDTSFTLLHTYKNKVCESDLIRHGKLIGTFFKNRKNLVLYASGDPDLLVDVAQAVNELAQTYKQNIKLKINSKTYTITPDTTYTQTYSMCSDSSMNCYYNKRFVGTYRYATNHIEFTPSSTATMPYVFKGMMSVAKKTKQHVCYLYENQTKSLLFNLYRRELMRKK